MGVQLNRLGRATYLDIYDMRFFWEILSMLHVYTYANPSFSLIMSKSKVNDVDFRELLNIGLTNEIL